MILSTSASQLSVHTGSKCQIWGRPKYRLIIQVYIKCSPNMLQETNKFTITEHVDFLLDNVNSLKISYKQQVIATVYRAPMLRR